MNISLIQLFFVIIGFGYFAKTVRLYFYDKSVFGLLLGIAVSICIVVMALTRI